MTDKRTTEVLNDKDLMDQVKKSKKAKGRPWKKVKRELHLQE
jgi:hypothetical protein